MQGLTYEEVVALWDGASAEPAWQDRVRAQAVAVRRLLLAIADARYVEGDDEAERSRTVYSALETDLDPAAPADAVRIRRLFDGPLRGGWPMSLIRRAFRRAADPETEIRCGTLLAQDLVLTGDIAGGEAIAHAILQRTSGSGYEGEGVSLLILERAASLQGRSVEALLYSGAAVRWAEENGAEKLQALAWQNRIVGLLTVGAVEAARDALTGLRARVEVLADDRRPLWRARARVLDGVVALFAGDAEGSLRTLRAAREDLSSTGAGDVSREYVDVEIDALRRLGQFREAEAVLARARAASTTPEQRTHMGALGASIEAAQGRVDPVVTFVDGLGERPVSDIAPGLRLQAIEHVLDTCPDDRRFDVVAAHAAPILASAIDARVGELVQFDTTVPEVSRAPSADHALLARRADPFARRDSRLWLDARAAFSSAPPLRDALRLDDGRPVACDGCGRVGARRGMWLPLRRVLPYADGEFARAKSCGVCLPAPA